MEIRNTFKSNLTTTGNIEKTINMLVTPNVHSLQGSQEGGSLYFWTSEVTPYILGQREYNCTKLELKKLLGKLLLGKVS